MTPGCSELGFAGPAAASLPPTPLDSFTPAIYFALPPLPCTSAQGDRRAGPSLSAFNYESVWGQRALREMYRAIMLESRSLLALPQPCRPGARVAVCARR